MSYTEWLHAEQQASLERAREQYLWQLCYDATEPGPEDGPYDEDDEDDTEEEDDT